MFNIMTTEKKFDFGVKNEAINNAMTEIALNLVKGERSAHADCKACYTVRENATEGKVNGEKWADFMQMKFGKRLTSSTAMKYATVYGVFGVPETGLLHDMWENYPVGKLIILSPLEGKKHKEAKRSIPAFMYYVGEWKNQQVKKPYTEWEKSNAETLQDIADFEAEGKKKLADKARKQLTPSPAKPVDLPKKATEKEKEDYFDTIVLMGYESIRTMNDNAVKEKVQQFIADNLTAEETEKAQKAEAEKAEKEAKEAPGKAAKNALDAMVAYISTIEADKVPDAFSTTVGILKEVCKPAENNKK